MYPHERSLVERFASKPFALIGVNSDADRDVAKQAVKDNQLNWRSFWNGPKGTSGPISTAWNATAWPTIYILDAKGVIRYTRIGDNEKEIDAMIEKLLKEMEK
jgi:hypothetical protein